MTNKNKELEIIKNLERIIKTERLARYGSLAGMITGLGYSSILQEDPMISALEGQVIGAGIGYHIGRFIEFSTDIVNGCKYIIDKYKN